MRYLKAFVAGLAIPSVVFPIIIFSLVFFNRLETLNRVPLYLVPFIWGVWNVGYFAVPRILTKTLGQNIQLWSAGIKLGFVLAIIGVFIFDAPRIYFGWTGLLTYLPLVLAPVLYGAAWRYVVKHLNRVVGLTK